MHIKLTQPTGKHDIIARHAGDGLFYIYYNNKHIDTSLLLAEYYGAPMNWSQKEAVIDCCQSIGTRLIAAAAEVLKYDMESLNLTMYF